jgi:hypothetical protein
MSLQPSGIILIAAILFFYIRLIWLQKAKITLTRQAAFNQTGGQKLRGKKGKKEKSYFDEYRFRINNWYVLIGAIVLIAAGAIISSSSLFGDTVRSLWWIPTAGGIFLGSFSIA